MSATVDQFRELLEVEDTILMDKLVDVARHGTPTKVRGEVWKYLLAVAKPDKAEEMKQERRQIQEYQQLDKTVPSDLRKTITNQILRTFAKTDFFLQESTQAKMAPFVYSLKNEHDIFWCFDALMKKLGKEKRLGHNNIIIVGNNSATKQ